MAVPDRIASRESSRPLGLLVVCLLILGAGFAGYQQIFSTHAAYDDEGYLMLSLRSFMEGQPLYDATYAQYGPGYYAGEALFHRVTGLPVTHDVTRMKTLGIWLAAALLAAVLILRLTGSQSFAAIAFLVAFFHLDRFCLEPGHPQASCVVALVAAPLLLTWFPSGRARVWIPIVLGLIAGWIATTKPNVGGLLVLAASLTFLLMGPRDRYARGLLAVALVVTLAMPFLVTRALVDLRSDIALPWVVACSTMALVMVALRERGAALFRWTDLAAFVGGAGLSLAGALGTAMATGTTAAGLSYGLVAQHATLAKRFATAAPLHPLALAWAVVAVLVAMHSGDRRPYAAVARLVAACALAWSCVRYLLESFVPLSHGMIDRGGAATLIGSAGPVLWVLLTPRHGAVRGDAGPPAGALASRLLLCLLAALQPLGAYPIPGTQLAVGSVSIALACVLAVDDATRMSAERAPRARRLAFGLLALLVCTLLARDVFLYRFRSSGVPLDLPGAARLRMAADEASRYRWLVETLRARCDTFVFGTQARNSLYFWTELRPPTALNATLWPFLLRSDEQERVVQAVRGIPRVGVVNEPFAGKLPNGAPLVAYIFEHFEPALRNGDVRVWLRKSSGVAP